MSELITVKNLSELESDKKFLMMNDEDWKKISPVPAVVFRYFQPHPSPGRYIYFVEKEAGKQSVSRDRL